MRRIESSSSINTYKQCPRKYYYRYIKKLPDKFNIYAVRGNIVHSALEHFFKIDPKTIKNYKTDIQLKLENLFDLFWVQNKEKLISLEMNVEDLNEFYLDSREMLAKWAQRLVKKIDQTIKEDNFVEAFSRLTPESEEEFTSTKIGVRGFVDAIYQNGDKIHVVDYKTSRKDIITPEYALQAGIYAILIHEARDIMPEKVSFDFLKGEVRDIIVDEELIKNTLFEIEQIHASTDSDDPREYKRKPSGLCKWSNERGSGECAYFNICNPRNPEKWED